MAMKIIVFSCLSALQYQVASSQFLRQQFGGNVIENPRVPRNVITQPRFNNPCPQTIITDCTPSVCQNLADTLQLMIVCNLLQNTNTCGCNDCINNLVLPCGCANAVSPNFISPRAISPSMISSNVISPSVISPSVFSNQCLSPVSVSNPSNRYLSLLGC